MTDNNPASMYEFPFRLRSELPEFSVSDNLHIARMSEEDKKRLLHIENAKYDENGRLCSFTATSDCLMSNMPDPHLDQNDVFCSSNYIVTASCPERAKEFDFALKLAGNSCTALYIGFKTDTPATYYINPPSYFQGDALSVEEKDVKKISKLLEQITLLQNDKKLKTMKEIYMHALSMQRRKESRFIEIAIILEMLLLPSQSAELAYRFSLRLAKLLNKLTGEPVEEAFGHAKSIYNTRSRLVHSGKDSKLDDISPTAYNYVRLLLSAYIEDKNNFTDDTLDKLCLNQ